jgi:hypothetical protein
MSQRLFSATFVCRAVKNFHPLLFCLIYFVIIAMFGGKQKPETKEDGI